MCICTYLSGKDEVINAHIGILTAGQTNNTSCRKGISVVCESVPSVTLHSKQIRGTGTFQVFEILEMETVPECASI